MSTDAQTALLHDPDCVAAMPDPWQRAGVSAIDFEVAAAVVALPADKLAAIDEAIYEYGRLM